MIQARKRPFKWVKEHFRCIIAIPYCRATNLLALLDPFAYSDNRSGWCCSYYNSLWQPYMCLCTGYNPIGYTDDVIEKKVDAYNKLASMVTKYSDNTGGLKRMVDIQNKLITRFSRECCRYLKARQIMAFQPKH